MGIVLTKAKVHVYGSSSALQSTKGLDDGLGHTVLGLVDVEVAQGAVPYQYPPNSHSYSCNACLISNWHLPLGLGTPVLVPGDLIRGAIRSYTQSNCEMWIVTWISPKASLSVRVSAAYTMRNCVSNGIPSISLCSSLDLQAQGAHTILPVVAKVLLERLLKDWRRGNCWRDRVLEQRARRLLREAGVRGTKATAARATAGEERVTEATERTAAREEMAGETMMTTGQGIPFQNGIGE